MDNQNIIKQDINFLDKPLWFQNLKHNGLGFVWTDIEGYTYRTGYKPPDKLDIIILLYLIIKLQQAQYANEIKLTRYEILKGCGFIDKDHSYYYNRLEDSLKRWLNISTEFNGTFYDGKKYISIGFHIIDSYKLDDSTQLIQIAFNKDWILKVKESTFFKYINFEYYKTLKRPLSRRLYELLCKTFKGRDDWSIGLVKLGTKLTLSGRTVTTKQGDKVVMYASDVLVAVKPAINEINRLSKVDSIAKKIKIHPDDLFTVIYTITGKGQDRVINFKKLPVIPVVSASEESTATNDLTALSEMVPAEHREKKTIQSAIVRYFKKYGFEYVKRNISYTNAHQKTNYRAYLDKALKNDWGLSVLEDGEEERLSPETLKFMKNADACWKQFQGNCPGFRGPTNATTLICKYCPGKR